MPEYLSPGVYIEETSYRNKTIEGVSTSTAGMVGQARSGPTYGRPSVLTSFSEFERIYGSVENIQYTDSSATNHLALAARAFFNNGGKRLYVARVATTDAKMAFADVAFGPSGKVKFTARFPGSEANRIRIEVKSLVDANANVVAKINGVNVLRGVYQGVLVAALYDTQAQALTGPLFVDYRDGKAVLVDKPGSAGTVQAIPDKLVLIEFEVQIFYGQRKQATYVYSNLSPSWTAQNYIGKYLDPVQPVDRESPIAILSSDDKPLQGPIDASTLFLGLVRLPIQLATGNDGGTLPPATSYLGSDEDLQKATGLAALAQVDDIAIVLAPDAAAENSSPDRHKTICHYLIQHCESLKYRMAILDAPQKTQRNDLVTFRANFDSSYAALYTPWIKISDPRVGFEDKRLSLPPSGSMAGIYARTDIERGVWRAPANTPISEALDFEFHINTGVQDVLNPQGINCLRFFEEGGFRVWGARTLSRDPEWKYINVRRLFIFLEHSIDRGTQWVVFEPNNERTWANVRSTIWDFLYNVWTQGALMGTKPEEAYFVRCDRSTMTQNDLDNGRLVCQIGVAVAKPAEFVIFRIGQWTANAKIS